jgi:hypothetical protein
MLDIAGIEAGRSLISIWNVFCCYLHGESPINLKGFIISHVHFGGWVQFGGTGGGT